MEGESDLESDDYTDYEAEPTSNANNATDSVVSDSVILQVLKTVADGVTGNVVIRIEKQGPSTGSSQSDRISSRPPQKKAKMVKKSSKRADNSDINTAANSSDAADGESQQMQGNVNRGASEDHTGEMNDDAQMYNQQDNSAPCGYGNNVHMQHNNTLVAETAGASGRVAAYGGYPNPSAQEIAATSTLENSGYMQPDHGGFGGGGNPGDGKNDSGKAKKQKAEVNEDVAVKMLEVQQQICNSVRGMEATLRDMAASQRQMVDIHRYIASKLEMAFQQKY